MTSGRLATFSLLLTLVWAGIQADRPQASPSPELPRTFADTTSAQLATDGEQRLWLLTTGYRKGELRLALHQHATGSWQRLKSPPQAPSGDAAVNVVWKPKTVEPLPCLGYTEAETLRPIITCLGLHRWFPQRIHGLLAPGARLIELSQIGGQLFALFQARSSRGKVGFRVIRTSVGGGHWEAAGPLLKTGPALAQLGGAGTPSGPRVELAVETQGLRPARYVTELKRDHWARRGPILRGPGLGPLLGGPVRIGGTTLLPVVDAERSPWSFSVFSATGKAWRPTATLSTGHGNAQGCIDFAAGDAWASWQEDREVRSGGFKAVNWVARLSPDGEVVERKKLWSGKVVGPGSTQVIAFQGDVMALYMRGDRGGRLVPAVKPIPAGWVPKRYKVTGRKSGPS